MDAHEKPLSSKPMDMIKAGGSGDGSGPTSSSRSYPKSNSMPGSSDSAPFNPMHDKKRGATTWNVGGVGG